MFKDSVESGIYLWVDFAVDLDFSLTSLRICRQLLFRPKSAFSSLGNLVKVDCNAQDAFGLFN